MRPSDDSGAKDGLFKDFRSIGAGKVADFVETLGLLARRPLLLVKSGGVSVIGVAKSSTSIRSATISAVNKAEYHRILRFQAPISCSLVVSVSPDPPRCSNRTPWLHHTPEMISRFQEEEIPFQRYLAISGHCVVHLLDQTCQNTAHRSRCSCPTTWMHLSLQI